MNQTQMTRTTSNRKKAIFDSSPFLLLLYTTVAGDVRFPNPSPVYSNSYMRDVSGFVAVIVSTTIPSFDDVIPDLRSRCATAVSPTRPSRVAVGASSSSHRLILKTQFSTLPNHKFRMLLQSYICIIGVTALVQVAFYVAIVSFIHFRDNNASFLPKVRHAGSNDRHRQQLPQIASGKQRRTRVACLIPYIGSTLPAWFDAFATTAYASAELFDFIIFVTKAPSREVPSNVKIIRIDPKDLYTRLVKLVAHELVERDMMLRTMQILIEKRPYDLVEFKPALGTIFDDYITGYSHWAIADLDVLIGRMQRIATPEILQQYDIYTASFGDSYRLYLRGQLTIHRNHPHVNSLWRQCDHLSTLAERLRTFAAGHYERWTFHSAEGCYSKVAVESNLTILVSPTQLSDAFQASLAERESFLLGQQALLRCYGKPLNVSSIEDIRRISSFIEDAPGPQVSTAATQQHPGRHIHLHPYAHTPPQPHTHIHSVHTSLFWHTHSVTLTDTFTLTATVAVTGAVPTARRPPHLDTPQPTALVPVRLLVRSPVRGVPRRAPRPRHHRERLA